MSNEDRLDALEAKVKALEANNASLEYVVAVHIKEIYTKDMSIEDLRASLCRLYQIPRLPPTLDKLVRTFEHLIMMELDGEDFTQAVRDKLSRL